MPADLWTGPSGLLEPPELSAAVPTSVESRTTFRLARLLLFIDVATRSGRQVPSVDRLGYYEFFSDNPFMVIIDDRHAEQDRLDLEMAGFSPVQLSYASTGQRFASRRQRLQHDLSLLVSRNLVAFGEDGFVATGAGAELATRLNSLYADAYRTAAKIVLRRLAPMSNKALEAAARTWLGESWLLIDLLDDIRAADAPDVSEPADPTPENGNKK